LRDNEEVANIINPKHSNDHFELQTTRGNIQAKKLIIAPGPYINDVIGLFNIKLNLTIWEMTSVYFKKLSNATHSTPTWFYFGKNRMNLYYGFPENSVDKIGYERVSPDFVYKPLSSPSERTNHPDYEAAHKTAEFVKLYMPHLDYNSYYVSNVTCLASMIPDDGFVLDFSPLSVPNNKRMIIFGAGWAFKFVPLFGDLLAQLSWIGKTDRDISDFSINIPGRLIKNSPTPVPSPNYLVVVIIVIVIVVVVVAAIGFSIFFYKTV